MAPGPRAWLALAALLAVIASALQGVPRMLLDWQPALAQSQPWRALSAVGVHYSARHLVVNLLGLALVALLGARARVPLPFVWAWAAAWPLTQAGLALRPDLAHYGGLSGVLHAGVAIVAVHLLAGPAGRPRQIGAGLLLVLSAKVASEAPWGAALRHPAGWDIAIAPLAHATGLVAGVVCGVVAAVWSSRRSARADA